MTTPNDKPREFWIGETDCMWHVAESWLDTQSWEFDVRHVIEYSAYQALEQKLAEAEKCLKAAEEKLTEWTHVVNLEAENTHLRSALEKIAIPKFSMNSNHVQFLINIAREALGEKK